MEPFLYKYFDEFGNPIFLGCGGWDQDFMDKLFLNNTPFMLIDSALVMIHKITGMLTYVGFIENIFCFKMVNSIMT